MLDVAVQVDVACAGNPRPAERCSGIPSDPTSRLEPPHFEAPRFDRPIDVEAMLARLPKHAATKGIIVASTLDALRRRPEHGEWTHERVLAEACGRTDMPGPFENVPYREFTSILLFVARLLRGDAIGEGLRELGRQVYPNFAATLIGRMLFGALRNDPQRMFAMGPRAWKVCENFGDVRAELLAREHVRYVFDEFPVELVETMYVGTIEGAGDVLGIELELEIAKLGTAQTLVDIRWRRSDAASE